MKNVPEVNDIVTIHNIGPILDRSYQNNTWMVVAVNSTHAQLKSKEGRGCLGDIIIVLIDEYEFQDAGSFK